MFFLPTEDIELGVGNLSLREDLNPFDPEIHAKLLKMIPVPVEKRHGFVDLRSESLPNIRPNSNVMIGENEFYCMECKGEGGYGKVFKVGYCALLNLESLKDLNFK